MATRILVPVDGSEQSMAAAEFAVGEFPEATLVLLHVINPAEAGYSAHAAIPALSQEWLEDAKRRAEDRFEEVRALEGADPERIETAVETGKPSRTIVEYAADNAVDQIVMGSHGRSGVSRLLLGSVAEAVVRRAPVPVTVTR